MTLEFEAPGPDAPGYLRRERTILEFLEREVSVGVYDEMVDFLLDYVKVPKDREKAKEALWEMSKTEFDELLELIRGRWQVPPKTEGDSDD